jgi:hypothetical protein
MLKNHVGTCDLQTVQIDEICKRNGHIEKQNKTNKLLCGYIDNFYFYCLDLNIMVVYDERTMK